MRFSLLSAILLAVSLGGLPIPLGAQQHDALRVGPALRPDTTRALPSTSARPAGSVPRTGAIRTRADLPDSCAAGPDVLRLLLEPPAGAMGGAAAGWLVFTFGIGALAADHGAEYRRTRRAFIGGGAVVGVALGIHRLVTVPTCASR